MTLKKEILIRVGVVYVACFLFALVILGRALQIQLVQGNLWLQKAQEVSLKDITITPERGNILDIEGRLLASSIPYYNIHMDMVCASDKLFNAKVDSLALCLSKLFKNKSKSEYARDLKRARSRGLRYYSVKGNINFLEMKQSKQFPIFREGKFKGGVIYSQKNIRINPHDPLAKRTLGYLNRGVSGTEVGIEGAFDQFLKGVEGVRLMQKLKGNIWMPVSDENEIEPVEGMDVVTTLDINLQDVAHNELKHQLELMEAEYGCVVLMEVQTGEVKAIVNLTKSSSGRYTEEYNYAIGESSEPGSTFKLVSLMVALEDRYISITDSIDLNKGRIKYHDKWVLDAERHDLNWVSVKRAFEISSNVGISRIIDQNYGQTKKERDFVDRIYQMGIHNKLGVSIKGEAKPYIKYPGEKYWSGVTLPQMSHGYEVRLTPLQTLSFYNAVANDGKMVKPIFVKAITDHGKIVKRFQTEVINHSICSKHTIDQAQEMLEGVVENGTARRLNDTPFKIAGKTGTAKLYDKKQGRYVNEYEASFVGYFPADNPKYSCIVIMHRPKHGGYHGSDAAAPVFKRIAHKVYASEKSNWDKMEMANTSKPAYTKSGNTAQLTRVLDEVGIQYESNGLANNSWVNTYCLDDRVKIDERKTIKGLVPNVLQMGVKDAVFLLESAGMNVKVVGRGTVVQQSIAPGTRINGNERIELKMSVI